jgi:hypothetical protein
MKKLLPLFVLGTVASANAQIVIDQTDFPTAGTSYWMAQDYELSPGVNLGSASSTPQSWDFSMLITDTLYAIEFYDPSTVDPQSQFPSADIALDQYGGYAFAEFTSGAVEIVGIAADFGAALGLPVPFEASVTAGDPWQIFAFPSSYGVAFEDTAIFDFQFGSDGLVPFPYNLAWDPDSIRVLRTVYSASEIDAEGTLTDVLAGNHNVLRQFVVETSIDSIWGYTTNGWEPAPNFAGVFENPQVATDSSFRFIGQEVGYIVVEIDVDGDGNPTDATFMSDPSQCCSGVEELAAAGQNILYPNPATDEVRVRTGGDIYQFQVFDMSGKLLLTTPVTYDGQAVKLNALSTGLYVYQMLDEGGRMAHTGRLSCIK